MQHWSKLVNHSGEPFPVRRSRHAAVCLNYGGDHPQLLVTGGLDISKKVLNDAWILDVYSGKWREVRHVWINGDRAVIMLLCRLKFQVCSHDVITVLVLSVLAKD